jgi:hypothetical protein
MENGSKIILCFRVNFDHDLPFMWLQISYLHQFDKIWPQFIYAQEKYLTQPKISASIIVIRSA